MKYEEGVIYHVYNRGINRQDIFFEEKNYYYIKSDCMKESKKKIKAPEPPDPFEKCLI